MDDLRERLARAICKTGKFETGEGTCAPRCMDQLGSAREKCPHVAAIHGSLADLILAEITAAGYAVVPREPTREMLEDGNTVTEDAGDICEPSHGISYNGPSCALECWQAMLAANPLTPSQ